jgi:sugar transferase (PEP-CTERM system associated)
MNGTLIKSAAATHERLPERREKSSELKMIKSRKPAQCETLTVSNLLSSASPVDMEFNILAEQHFHGMLHLEQKRKERSGKPFFLLLIDAKGVRNDSERRRILRVVSNIKLSTLRETDVIGWYEYGYTLGVIFTEIGDADINQANESIFNKVHDYLRHSLNSQEIEKICVAVHQPESERTPLCLCNNIDITPCTNDNAEDNSNDQTALSPIWGSLLGQRWFLLLGDMVLISIASLLGAWIRFANNIDLLVDYTGAFALTLLFAPMCLYVFDMYNTEKRFGLLSSAYRISLAFVTVTLLLSVLFYMIPQWQFGRGMLFVQTLLAVLFLVAWRTAYSALLPSTTAKIPTLIVGAGESGMAVYKLLKTPFSPYEVKGFLDDDPGLQGRVMNSPAVLGTLDQIKETSHELGIRAAVLAIPRNRPLKIVRKILEARLQGLEVLELPDVYEQLTGRVPVEYIEDNWLLFSNGFYLLSKQYVQKLKRLMDFAIAGVGIFLATPLMAITALAIRLDSPGPVFYKQERVGKGSKVFTLFKFRSMGVNAEAQGAAWAQKCDPRVTRVGKWIRLFRIDEIPQLWNVFKGDMSLIGPRPERPEFIKDLETKIPYYNVRHTVPPGVTGWAQVRYPYGASLEDSLRKLEYDLFYIKNMSIVLDLKILLRTMGVILLGEGAR